MPINFATVKTSLFAWVASVAPSGTPIIYWQQNSPRPTVPYITLFLSSVTAPNQDWTSFISSVSGVVNMQGDRQFTLEVQAYGSDPLTLMENIRTSLQKQTVLDGLRANGIVFYSSLTINDITELVDSQFERRAQLDILFGIGQQYTDAPGFFDHVQIQEIISNELPAVIFNQTYLIPNP